MGLVTFMSRRDTHAIIDKRVLCVLAALPRLSLALAIVTTKSAMNSFLLQQAMSRDVLYIAASSGVQAGVVLCLLTVGDELLLYIDAFVRKLNQTY